MSVAVAVVLYRPDEATVEKVRGYAAFADVLIVIDNTDAVDISDTFTDLVNCCYRPQRTNLGVASALNTAAGIALQKHCSWMTILDQDSRLTRETYGSLQYHAEHPLTLQIALITPIQRSERESAPVVDVSNRLTHRQVTMAMSSGSTINLAAYQTSGPFHEPLFIDHVDTEYCFRLQRFGYQLVQIQELTLEHSLGEYREAAVFGRVVAWVTHKPFRSYYYVRNGLYVCSRYFLTHPRFVAHFGLRMAKEIIKLIMVEDQKSLRAKMMALGFIHFCAAKYGRLSTKH